MDIRNASERIEFFPELSAQPWLRHGFTLRAPSVDTALDRDAAVANLRPFFRECAQAVGGDFDTLQTAEQVHGAGVAIAGDGTDGLLPNLHAGVDALITERPGPTLGILVADCCAVYVCDPVRRAIGLAHSGKKGTELGIVPATLRRMEEAFGSKAGDLLVRLSPCIRPPHYESDFAAEIRRQCREAGVSASAIADDECCTACHPSDYYSYRLEQGKTGRMLALLGIA